MNYLLLMGWSWPTAACMKSNASPPMGQLHVQSHIGPHVLMGSSQPTAACKNLHASPRMGQLHVQSYLSN